ncbi:hypothetical protein SPWS13_3174 [Shewanella putrefaciens]|nr:hypothetical protein SPWS13_3174 [Shewanella putrefaciens]
MNEFNTFFAQAYWWLSLLGGLHCLALAIYIRYFYHADGNQKLLASFLSLIALYFLTGMLNRDNTPIPIHILFNLINPIYFLLMPLLYLYCKRSLEQRFEPIGFSKHYWPSIFTLFIAVIDIFLRIDLEKNPIWFQAEIILHQINIDISHWGSCYLCYFRYKPADILLLCGFYLDATKYPNKSPPTHHRQAYV